MKNPLSLKTFKINPETIFLTALFLFALAVRVGYLLFLRKNYAFYNDPSSDVLYYQDWANSIARGNWLGTNAFYGLPLFPYFLAVLQRLTLGNGSAVRFFFLCLGSINCVLTYLLAKELFAKRTAMIAGILAASNFILIYYDWLMMPVTLLIFLSLSLILSIRTAEKKAPGGSSRQWFLVGSLLGLAALGDGKFLIFLPFVFFYLTWKKRADLATALKKIIAPLALGVFLILSITILRNLIVVKDWVFITNQTGLSFFVGNNPSANGLYSHPDFIRPHHRGQDEDQQILAKVLSAQDLSPSQVSKFWSDQAFHFMRKSPYKFLALIAKKFLLFFSDDERAHDVDLLMQRRWRLRWDINSFYIICPLAIIGFLLARKQGIKGLGLPSLLILSQLLFTLIFFLQTRHRATILPFILIFEAFFISYLLEKWTLPKRKIALILIFALTVYFSTVRPRQIDPNELSVLTSTKYGYLNELQGNYTQARSYYLKALALQPQDMTLTFNLANTYLLQKKYAEAQKSYEKVLSVLPFHVDALFNLGYAQEHSGDLSDALLSYQKLLDWQPSSIDVNFRIANVYMKMHQCDKAMEHTQLILQQNPRFQPRINELLRDCPSPSK